ncbi:hypothetical protein FACS1894204_12850 [Synergistales bacterium]|nr:hypothetical protein FACS1894204_12850 [Synergistales bacterium]
MATVGNAINNIVTINAFNGSLLAVTGSGSSPNDDQFTGNKLNINNTAGTIANVFAFEFINFGPGVTNAGISSLKLLNGHDVKLDVDSGESVNFGGVIQPTNTGDVGSITKTGAGTLTLSGANTYTGTTTVEAGTLVFNSANSVPTNYGAITAAPGATVKNNSGANITVNGSALANNGSYTCPTIPDAPTNVTATAGNAQATITFTAPANDGSTAIIDYTVTSNPGNFTATDTTSPITVTGLTNGTAYTFTVTATNSKGESAASATSNSVTPSSGTPAPVAPSITTTTLANGTVNTAYSHTLTATGDAPVAWSIAGGSLPNGLTLSNAGAISGSPTAAGAFAFTVKASNGVNPDATKDFSITIAAAPSVLDPYNNVTIGSVQTNLGDDANGNGWTWDASTKTLMIDGDLNDEIIIASATDDITIYISDSVNVPKIVKTGDSALIITGETGKTLTAEDANGPAISSDGDIYIDSGTVKANVTGTGNTESAIQAGGDITITGTANVTASNSGTGYAINANNGNGTISITGGHTELTGSGDGTNPYPPAMSGANTVVIVNGQIIFGDSTTPDNPDSRNRGGCNAGAGLMGLAALALLGANRSGKGR